VVTQGKWYFEFEAVTVGEMRVGWARPSVRADTELGADEFAYVFNGFKVPPQGGASGYLLSSKVFNRGFPKALIQMLVVARRHYCLGFSNWITGEIPPFACL